METATVYTLKNRNGIKVEVSDLGATLKSLFVPNKEGKLYDVVLGFDRMEDYIDKAGCYFGATVGRNANRIGNASFELEGKTYFLDKNNGENNLHGGFDGYSYRIWDVKEVGEQQITFSLHSPDQDQGFPGDLYVEVTYLITDENELKIHYYGIPESTTIINMTNHSYFNLNGHGSGNVEKHRVWIDADFYTPTDAGLIPTGEIASVENTPMDFRVKKELGEEIGQDFTPLVLAGGYDHNWCLNNHGKFAKVAELEGDQSGIVMEVYTDLPGVQMYAGNFVENTEGKEGVLYQKRQGVCFETQYYPDAIHKENFQKPVFAAGETYDTTTSYKFIIG